MSRDHAPVVLFAYRRPDHLKRALASLSANPAAKATSLTIYCDGPKSSSDAQLVEQTRAVAHSARVAQGFKEINVIERTGNLGLAKSVISGVTAALETCESVIVMEDDLVVSTNFLDYMNEALELYEGCEEVISIHGYMYAVRATLPQTVFIKGADCWGWATWRRGWELFEPDSKKLLKELDQAPDRAQFDFDGAFPYRKMLIDQAKGTIDSWAIRWYASAFLSNKLTLYPGRSLVKNIGQEGSGTHSESAVSHQVAVSQINLPLAPLEISESAAARDAVTLCLWGARSETKWTRFTSRWGIRKG
ncbi:glycosyltransferase [Actinomycetota bacterium]|nr:glycosyltransferase [Actinomycetota bacterium]